LESKTWDETVANSQKTGGKEKGFHKKDIKNLVRDKKSRRSRKKIPRDPGRRRPLLCIHLVAWKTKMPQKKQGKR